jgi:hypothetical protein
MSRGPQLFLCQQYVYCATMPMGIFNIHGHCHGSGGWMASSVSELSLR